MNSSMIILHSVNAASVVFFGACLVNHTPAFLYIENETALCKTWMCDRALRKYLSPPYCIHLDP